MSLKSSVTIGCDSLRGFGEQPAVGRRVCERVLEDLERAPVADGDLERLVRPRVVDGDGQLVRVSVPQQGDLDSVVLPVCKLHGHRSSFRPREPRTAVGAAEGGWQVSWGTE